MIETRNPVKMSISFYDYIDHYKCAECDQLIKSLNGLCQHWKYQHYKKEYHKNATEEFSHP